MGAMNCDKNGCNTPMCSILINDMYICGGCFGDFKESIGDDLAISEKEWVKKFAAFMAEEKVEGSNKIMNLDEFVEKHNRCK